ncbi:hypothetical protein QOZ80_2BG0191400 [Eleusine coracana subsp. coracana]|nr:hypothetical protein QOZ80_2BG0191400 [Eleusine coracana subsp. coracana]
MWRFNPFGGKVQNGLEGHTIDVGNLKITVRNIIAEGGFSCVYLASDALHVSKQYALKHIICNDSESLDLVMKEIKMMDLLKGHPNVVTLVAHDVFDMGRTKEALLVMEFCEKSLVSAMERRGSGYYEEKKALLIFRDVCNAVFAMHGQSPPIAHRDLKAENVLLGFDGAWKICDFGSTSTNHKCFDRPEEMGIEEDIIRRHTTPAYRAPEMWDLYRKEVISEKVDIWALGCLLYRICYFKSAFDGESKLQILNGNYRIPEQPKYSTAVTGLIRDMLEASPSARPDITQVWFHVNELLPLELQKNLPDGASSTISMVPQDEGAYKRTPVMPRRNPPPPSKERSISSSHGTSKAGDAPLDFDSNNLHAGTSVAGKASDLELELSSLKEQLKKTTLEKDEMTAKYEKLSAICRSQRQEIQELKRTLAESTPPSNKISSRAHGSVSQRKEKMEGTVWELEQGMLATNFSAPSSEAMAWQAFPEPKAQARPKNITIVNVSGNRCCTGQQA